MGPGATIKEKVDAEFRLVSDTWVTVAADAEKGGRCRGREGDHHFFKYEHRSKLFRMLKLLCGKSIPLPLYEQTAYEFFRFFVDFEVWADDADKSVPLWKPRLTEHEILGESSGSLVGGGATKRLANPLLHAIGEAVCRLCGTERAEGMRQFQLLISIRSWRNYR